MVCLNHPDRESVTICAACGKPLCDECIFDFEDADYCSADCRDKGEASNIRASVVIQTSDRVDRKSRKRAFIWFILLLLLVAGGWYYYSKNSKAIDNHLLNGLKTLKETKDEAINAGKGAMPQDSKYKRERENMVNQQ